MWNYIIYNHTLPFPFRQIYDKILSNTIVILDTGRVEGRILEDKIHQEIKDVHGIEVIILEVFMATTADCPLCIINQEIFDLPLIEDIKTVFLRYDAAGRPNAYLDQEQKSKANT